jgi:hypothetical protein
MFLAIGNEEPVARHKDLLVLFLWGVGQCPGVQQAAYFNRKLKGILNRRNSGVRDGGLFPRIPKIHNRLRFIPK